MKYLYCIYLMFCFLLCSCSYFVTKPPQPQVEPMLQTESRSGAVDSTKLHPVPDSTKIESGKIGYKKNGITFKIASDPMLNKYKNGAHALLLCVYQLKDPNAFNQFSEEKDGVPKLLECNRFDSSVANSKKIIVQPGQIFEDVRDRAEGTRFIGLVTGYFGMEKGRVTYMIPLAISKGDYSGQAISITLGPYEIDSVMVK